jgi:hypothetical protein
MSERSAVWASPRCWPPEAWTRAGPSEGETSALDEVVGLTWLKGVSADDGWEEGQAFSESPDFLCSANRYLVIQLSHSPTSYATMGRAKSKKSASQKAAAAIKSAQPTNATASSSSAPTPGFAIDELLSASSTS